MITYEQYVGKWGESKDLTPERVLNIQDNLLPKAEGLWVYLTLNGVNFPTNPATHSQVSGQTYGGFRPQDCPQGAPRSSHKEGLAVDIYDPLNQIDNYLLAHPELLEEFGIYIEHPNSTPKWSHWSARPPLSKRHIFHP
jgi:hypothetical protein